MMKLVLMSVFSILFFSTQFLFKKPDLPSVTDYMAPPKAIKYFSVGLRQQFADSLWLRALQDFDYCEQKINETECSGKSWLFQVLDLATDLDPQFEAVMYQAGGLALTIIISDYAGASVIFDKGVEQYPKHWQLVYAAAYHALYEEKNKVKAAKLYNSVGLNGGPPWTLVLAGKLASEGGDQGFAELILQQMIDANQDEKLVKRLKEKLSQVRKK